MGEPSNLGGVGGSSRGAPKLAMLVVCALVAAACGASPGSVAFDEVEGATVELVEGAGSPIPTASAKVDATSIPEPTPTSQPTVVPALTSAPVATATATVTPEPTATVMPIAAAMSSDGFELEWDDASVSVATVLPDVPAPPVRPAALAGNYSGLELNSYKLTDGVLLAVSLVDNQINGYVLFFDPDSLEAVQSVITLGFSLTEGAIWESAHQVIFQEDPLYSDESVMSFDGVSHGIELARVGVDPINDPLWILTALPKNSSIDHNTLRTAGAEAALESF